MQSLTIAEESLSNYAQPTPGAGGREFYVPPTTHFIATVDDLTDMLDYASEVLECMDDDAEEGQSQNPPLN